LFVLVFDFFSDCQEWSAVPVAGCLRRGPRGFFRSECCTGGKTMPAPCVNRSIAPTNQRQVRGRTGRKCFSSVRCDPTGNRTQPISFGEVQSTNHLADDRQQLMKAFIHSTGCLVTRRNFFWFCTEPCPAECKDACSEQDGDTPPKCNCHAECLGRCTAAHNASACVACRNFHHEGRCVPKCPETTLLVSILMAEFHV